MNFLRWWFTQIIMAFFSVALFARTDFSGTRVGESRIRVSRSDEKLSVKLVCHPDLYIVATQALGLGANTRRSFSSLLSMVPTLRKALAEEGFSKARISFTQEDGIKGKVIVITIDEGKRSFVDSLEIVSSGYVPKKIENRFIKKFSYIARDRIPISSSLLTKLQLYTVEAEEKEYVVLRAYPRREENEGKTVLVIEIGGVEKSDFSQKQITEEGDERIKFDLSDVNRKISSELFGNEDLYDIINAWKRRYPNRVLDLDLIAGREKKSPRLKFRERVSIPGEFGLSVGVRISGAIGERLFMHPYLDSYVRMQRFGRGLPWFGARFGASAEGVDYSVESEFVPRSGPLENLHFLIGQRHERLSVGGELLWTGVISSASLSMRGVPGEKSSYLSSLEFFVSSSDEKRSKLDNVPSLGGVADFLYRKIASDSVVMTAAAVYAVALDTRNEWRLRSALLLKGSVSVSEKIEPSHDGGLAVSAYLSGRVMPFGSWALPPRRRPWTLDDGLLRGLSNCPVVMDGYEPAKAMLSGGVSLGTDLGKNHSAAIFTELAHAFAGNRKAGRFYTALGVSFETKSPLGRLSVDLFARVQASFRPGFSLSAPTFGWNIALR